MSNQKPCAAVASVALCSLLLFWPFSAAAHEPSREFKFEKPLGQQGTISVRVQTDQAYQNGPGSKVVSFNVFEIPGVAKCSFLQSPTVCELQWVWLSGVKAEDLKVEIPGLPGPEEYFIQYTWDASAGHFTGYVNGSPLRLPGTALPKWNVPDLSEVRLPSGPVKVTFVSAEPRYLNSTQARAQVPESLRGHRAALFGVTEDEIPPLNIATRLGELLYESALDKASDMHGWIMEGPGLAESDNGWMHLKAAQARGENGHIVYWCPRDFPDRFVAEWEMQVLSEEGLCITFFAAEGRKGEDILSPTLPKRTGIFKQYTQGAINCYHISYFANTPSAPGRITSNMRKNSGFHVVANGPPGIEPGSKSVHAVRLIKDAAHVQLQVDGKVIIDFEDDGRRYGPVLHGGKIGFRQMEWTLARYRDFRVHGLAPEKGGSVTK